VNLYRNINWNNNNFWRRKAKPGQNKSLQIYNKREQFLQGAKQRLSKFNPIISEEMIIDFEKISLLQ